MSDGEWLAEEFEAHRGHLQSVAYRMLGSRNEADDAVQESWIRLSRAGADDIENLGGWLTTVVARVCLDMLRSRAARREDPAAVAEAAADAPAAGELDPEQEAVLADSLGPALLVVLDTLTPAERLAFVLHDMFAVPFDDIAGIIGRSPAATRQLASRARRRVQGSEPGTPHDVARQRQVVDAFLAASRDGDFDALLALLDPDVVLRADAAAISTGAPDGVHGAQAVAETFAGRARAAQPVLVDGAVGLAWAPRGVPQVVFGLAIDDGRIVEIEILADPELLAEMELVLLDE
jgi:RNA polymerase sigma factor (sigma-70 family)